MIFSLPKQFLCVLFFASFTQYSFAKKNTDFVNTYSSIAYAVYEDSLITAKVLQNKINALLKSPSDDTLNAAKNAWKLARIPYSQSEAFRFGNNNVDLWEGKVNAWPLDEGMIDYVALNYQYEIGNIGSTANLIANNAKFVMNGTTVDTSTITFELLFQLHEYGGSEANVTSGYHAIEFLLWGQDLNGTGVGAGNRPYTDYAIGSKCTNGHCHRRAQYLRSAVELLIIDLEDMVEQWSPTDITNYRAKFAKLPTQEALRRILFGIGNFSLGELAGERMKVALDTNSTEDEQDCFSDNTHFSHFYNAKGIKNIYLGEYKRIDGSTLRGPSLSSLMKEKNTLLDKKLKSQLAETETRLQAMVDAAENTLKPMKFDQMVAASNQKGRLIVQKSIQSLIEQTVLIEKVAKTLGITTLN